LHQCQSKSDTRPLVCASAGNWGQAMVYACRAADLLLVDDTHIVQAMRLVHQHAGLQPEPAGAVGEAALAAHPALFKGQRVATVLCGSNITRAQIATYLQWPCGWVRASVTSQARPHP
jgi:threonine dehydratase